MAKPVLVMGITIEIATMYCFSLKMRRTCGNTQGCSLSRLKPGLHVTIAEQACYHVLKGVLKLLIYRWQTSLVKYIQLFEDQGIPGKLKKRVRNLVLTILTTYTEARLKDVVHL